MTNRELVDKALEELRKGLRPFVLRSLEAQFGTSWKSVVERYMPGRKPSVEQSAEQLELLDAHALLLIMWDQWHEVFRQRLDRLARTYVSELRDVRNLHAHQATFSEDDAHRALDTIARLLRMVAAKSEAEAVRGLLESERHAIQGRPLLGRGGSGTMTSTHKSYPTSLDSVSVTWDDFEGALFLYRDEYFLGGSPERHYIEVLNQLGGLTVQQRAQHTEEIVLFLNRWHCRFSRLIAPLRLREWIERETPVLTNLAALSVDMPSLLTHISAISTLYDSVFRLKEGGYRKGIHNMSDACASKVLHLLVPGLFVMWDVKIKPPTWNYGRFMIEMHQFARRLSDLAPPAARSDIEQYLQGRLDYPVRKSLAKYIDEYNWYVAYH